MKNLLQKRKWQTKPFFLMIFVLMQMQAFAQTGVIKGKVLNQTDKQAIGFANVAVQNSSKGVTTDENGNFEISGLNPGLYNVVASFVGFKSATVFEVEVTNARAAIIEIILEEESTTLKDVEVTATGFLDREESPLSLRTIGINEIKRNPGGNRDISRALRALPGVASTVSFRNDILIRGGAPSENKFYLDGIEVPTINHFSTQGASGGPVGIINVDFLREVDFYSGAFPSNRGNTLSSVLEFKQKEARTDKFSLNAVVGASDLGVWVDTPINSKSGLIFSVRRSYLQFLFELLNLPFLPTYNSFQLKYTYNFNSKNRLTIVGLGAIDNFKLNENAGDDPENEDFETNVYLLNTLPVNNQWNYTLGAKYEIFRKDGAFTFVLSRNKLNNERFKHPNNDENLPRDLDYLSQETENKFRFEDDRFFGNGFKLNYGVNYEFAQYSNRTLQRLFDPSNGNVVNLNYNSALDLNKWGAFAQLSKTFSDKLVLSVGFRADANDYSDEMNNLLDQFSPRFSAKYNFTKQFSFNFNTGIYYQLPAYTALGYQENGILVNKVNDLKYIRNAHLVGGVEYRVDKRNMKFTLEGFYKRYNNYPFSVRNGVSLANLGGDFGVIGNEPLTSTSEGRSYGIEFLAQQKFYKGIYGILSYTFVRSEFANPQNDFVPTSWDSRHLISFTGGIQFGKNWEFATRWLFSGGTPFTPYDLDNSLRQEVWDAEKRGLDDFTRLNTERINAFHQLDIRIDKKWFFKKWSLNLFFDIQNVYNFEAKTRPILEVQRDANGTLLTDPNNAGRYLPKFLEDGNGTVLPTLGIILEL